MFFTGTIFYFDQQKAWGLKNNIFGPNQFCHFDICWIKTNNQIDKEAKIIYMNFLINHVREAARGEAVSSPTPTPYNSE